MMRWWFAMAAVLLATSVAASAPETSPLPIARGQSQVQVLQAKPLSRLVPRLRPATVQTTAPVANNSTSVVLSTRDDAADTPTPIELSALLVSRSLMPQLRPQAVVQQAMAKRTARRRGAVCNDPDIQGETVGYVPGQVSGCGVKDAVRVRSVSGVSLSQQAVMDCGTARALKKWITGGMKRAVGNYGGGVTQIRVAAHYACRTRNSIPGAKISEHGKGRAIDISGFTLRNGKTITLLKGWNQRKEGRILREMHSRACGPFGTVLGPEANKFHLDHFHFDTARYRSGSYCR